MIVRAYGLHWRRENVFWGKQKNSGHLLGSKTKSKKAKPVDFREQIGVYALYDETFGLVYFGQVGSGKSKTLYDRIKDHTKDHLSERWSRFSWFGVRSVNGDSTLSVKPMRINEKTSLFLDHIEAVVLSVSEPPNNRQGGRFGSATQFFQYRDEENLGLSHDDMIARMYNNFIKE